MSHEDSKQALEESDFKGSRRITDDDSYKHDSKHHASQDVENGAMAKSVDSSDNYEQSKDDRKASSGSKGYCDLCLYFYESSSVII